VKRELRFARGGWRRFASASAIALFGASGCYRVTVVDNPTPGATEHSEWTHFFLFGLVGEAAVDAREECAGSPVEIGREEDALTALVSVATAGIYTPARVTIECARDAAPEVASGPRPARRTARAGASTSLVSRPDAK